MDNFDLNELMDLEEANESRLRSGGPRGSHVAGRLDKHLREQ